MADELLRALGRVQGAQQAERERVHAGPGAAADEFLRPLDADEQADILDAVLGPAASSLATSDSAARDSATSASAGSDAATRDSAGSDSAARDPAGSDTAARDTAGSDAAAHAPAVTGGAEVIPLARPAARRSWLAGAGSLAAAAALAVVLWQSDGGDGPGLPAYSVVLADGDADVRGEPRAAGALRLRADTTVDLRLEPASAVDGAVGLRVVATRGDAARWITVDEVAQISSHGVIRLRGRAGAWLALPPGDWTLDLVIGRPERLPADLDAYQRGVERPHERGWQIERVQVHVED